MGCVLGATNGFHEAAIGYGFSLHNDQYPEQVEEHQRLNLIIGETISEWVPYLTPEVRKHLGAVIHGCGDNPPVTVMTTKLNTIHD